MKFFILFVMLTLKFPLPQPPECPGVPPCAGALVCSGVDPCDCVCVDG